MKIKIGEGYQNGKFFSFVARNITINYEIAWEFPKYIPSKDNKMISLLSVNITIYVFGILM